MENIIRAIKKSCIKISHEIKNSNSLELCKVKGEFNNSGDDVKILDILSNNILIDSLKNCSSVRTIGSEENKELIKTNNIQGEYMVCFDPLDGSSNIDCNITIGTIYAIYKYDNDNIINNGHNIVNAGYCLYGGCTQLIMADKSVNIYQLIDNEFILTNKDIKMSSKGNIYSLNESNNKNWNPIYNELIENLKLQGYNSRWVGSLVADGHRTLIKNGFFAYPSNIKNKSGKIRLLYEAYPFAFIYKVAGGYSSNGYKSILDIDYPENCHQKTPIILSSKYELDIFNEINKDSI